MRYLVWIMHGVHDFCHFGTWGENFFFSSHRRFLKGKGPLFTLAIFKIDPFRGFWAVFWLYVDAVAVCGRCCVWIGVVWGAVIEFACNWA